MTYNVSMGTLNPTIPVTYQIELNGSVGGLINFSFSQQLRKARTSVFSYNNNNNNNNASNTTKINYIKLNLFTKIQGSVFVCFLLKRNDFLNIK